MTLLSEMVRNLATEDNLLNNTTEYTRTNAVYGTIHDYGNVVLPAAGLLLVSFDGYCDAGTGSIRIQVGANYAYAASITTVVTRFTCIVYLAAGTYNVLAESGMCAAQIRIDNFQAGYISFSDLTGTALAAYAGAMANTTTVRLTPLGAIKNTVYCVTVHATTPGEATNMEQVGGAETNGVQVLIDAVQTNWAERQQGIDNDQAAGGKAYIVASAGTSHSITITTDDANTVVTCNVAVCPWILPVTTTFEPVTLTLPQGSTVYLTTEQLDANPSKTVRVGKERAIPFGAVIDYYSTASATGISTFNYIFESVTITSCNLEASGFGGCISILAVDIR